MNNSRLRLSLLQGMLYAFLGLHVPFWPIFLSTKGLDASAIGKILAAAYAARMISNPLAGFIADHWIAPPRLLAILIALAFATTGTFILTNNFYLLWIISFLSFGFYSAMLPLADSLTMKAASREKFSYGHVRLCGSIAFILVSWFSGKWLVTAPGSVIWQCAMGILVLVWGSIRLVPCQMDDKIQHPTSGSIKELLHSGSFPLFIIAAGITQASHLVYYGFVTLHWRASGLSGQAIGGLWAEGVIAEILLFIFGDRLIRHIPPLYWIAAGALAGIFRWSILALTTELWILASVQFLHAFTFAATHLGAMHFINQTLPVNHSAKAQGIYSSVTAGLIPALAMPFCGKLYSLYAGHAFFAMTISSLLGLGLTIRLIRLRK